MNQPLDVEPARRVAAAQTHAPRRNTFTVFILARALVYSTLFIGFLLVFLPARLVVWSGMQAPARLGVLQIAGVAVGAAGAVLAASCILTFVFIGRGTPAPFDPPRGLVIRGPYRVVRNPMYIGAAAALSGGALYYESLAVAAYAAAFLVVMHLFVIVHEEPALRSSFGQNYDDYCRSVRRWLPRVAIRNIPS